MNIRFVTIIMIKLWVRIISGQTRTYYKFLSTLNCFQIRGYPLILYLLYVFQPTSKKEEVCCIFFYNCYFRTFDWVKHFKCFFYFKASASHVVPFHFVPVFEVCFFFANILSYSIVYNFFRFNCQFIYSYKDIREFIQLIEQIHHIIKLVKPLLKYNT